METTANACGPILNTAGNPRAPLASNKHTMIFLMIVLVLTGLGAYSAAHAPAAGVTASPSTLLGGYAFMIAMQMLWVRFVQKGMQARGRSIVEFIGHRWSTPAVVVQDIAYAALACGLIHVISSSLQDGGDTKLQGLLPKGVLEIGLWLCMALAAGICEEIVFRGYLQRQLAALTGKTSVAIIGQAIIFGVGHSYQGLGRAAVIVLIGLVLGMLAAWRGNIRAGIVAHAALDIWGGLSG